MKKLLLSHFLFLISILSLPKDSFSQNVGIGTTTPLARLHITDSSVLFSSSGDIPAIPGNTPISGSGRRMMWYPDKAAFRVGSVNSTNWDKNNIGDRSIAFGFDSKASGTISTAMGYGTIASGQTSTAIGFLTIASATSSTAMGFAANASGQTSTAMGQNTIASGLVSTAMGYQTTASGTVSTSLGNFSIASGAASTAMGQNTIASGDASTAMGSETTASGTYSTAIGESTMARSGFETVLGRWNSDYTPASTTGWVATDRLFAIGNGTGPGALSSNAITVLKNGNTGIGTNDPLSPLHVNGVSLFTPGGSNIQVLDGNNIQAYINGGLNLTTYSDDPIKFRTFTSGGSGGERMRILSNGNMGIGTTTPAASLEVNGYTKLGSDAPSIKMKKLTGTTAATEGGGVSIATGLTNSKILSVSVMVGYTTSDWLCPNYGQGYNFVWEANGGNIMVWNAFGGSANILSKPIKILVTYEE